MFSWFKTRVIWWVWVSDTDWGVWFWDSDTDWGVWFWDSKTSSMGRFRGSEAEVESCAFQALKGGSGAVLGAQDQARLAGFRVRNTGFSSAFSCT